MDVKGNMNMSEMNIFSMAGDLVRFSTQHTGDKFDEENGLQYLKAGQVYTVDFTEPRSDHTNVFIREVPGICFNSVQFEAVTEPKPPDCSWSEIEGMLMPLTHQTIMDQDFQPGTPLAGELESIRRYYYEFTMVYRYYAKRYHDPVLARRMAWKNLSGRHQPK